MAYHWNGFSQRSNTWQNGWKRHSKQRRKERTAQHTAQNTLKPLNPIATPQKNQSTERAMEALELQERLRARAEENELEEESRFWEGLSLGWVGIGWFSGDFSFWVSCAV